jgi:NADPH:quinone reductase-like Zn-dependent oxidoreductase
MAKSRRIYMKAAIITAPGVTPIYGEFEKPSAKEGEEIISVRAAALTNLTKSRASGAHYSSSGIFPAVVGTDGVGVTQDGRRVYFAMPEAPNGAMAEFCAIHARRCVAIPDTVDDITAAAIANPGMSAWAGLVERAHLVSGETVLVNGATGTAGRIAVQLAKHLGAAKVIATGRNRMELEEMKAIGADTVIPFLIDAQHPTGVEDYEEALNETFSQGIDVVIRMGEARRDGVDRAGQNGRGPSGALCPCGRYKWRDEHSASGRSAPLCGHNAVGQWRGKRQP